MKPMANMWISTFVYSSAGVLLFTGLAKLISAAGHAGLLLLPDPLLGVQNRWVLCGAGICEVVLGLLIMRFGTQKARLAAIAWVATNLLIYRVGLFLLGNEVHCRCLGNLTDAIGMPPATVDSIMRGLLAYLLLGSVAGLAAMFSTRGQLHHDGD